jgi:hypothetical protein
MVMKEMEGMKRARNDPAPILIISVIPYYLPLSFFHAASRLTAP